MKEQSNYRYSQPCCWCKWHESEETTNDVSNEFCEYHGCKVSGLYTCDEWEESFEEE